MTAVPVAERMTAERFLELPVPQRGRPWNLVNGEVVVNDSSWLHGRVVGELLFALEIWARAEAGRGEVSVPLVALELGVADALTSPQLDACAMAVGDLFPPR